MNELNDLNKIKLQYCSGNTGKHFYRIWTTDYNKLCKIMYYDENIYKKIMRISENGSWTYYTFSNDKITNLFFESNLYAGYNFYDLTDELKEICFPHGKCVRILLSLSPRKLSYDEMVSNKITLKMFTNVIKLFSGEYEELKGEGDDEGNFTDYTFCYDPNNYDQTDQSDQSYTSVLREYKSFPLEEDDCGITGEYGNSYLDIKKHKHFFDIFVCNFYADRL